MRLLFILLFSASVLSAQRSGEFKKTMYEQLFAENHIQTWQTHQLKSKVKSYSVIDGNDTTEVYFFNEKGQLEKTKKKQKVVSYVFDKNHKLVEMSDEPTTKYGYYNATQTFFKGGMLHKQEITQLDNGTSFDHKISYNYNEQKKELVLSFDYDDPKLKNHYDLPKKHSYKFEFDKKNGCISQEIATFEGEDGDIFSNTKSYTYGENTKLCLPIGVSVMDACFGSNSCLYITYNLSYDKNGNILSENAHDATIRNSTWSYSYNRNYKYNADNQVIAEKVINDMDFRTAKNFNPTQEVEFTHFFEYEYDPQGNWIVQKKIDKSGKTPKIIKTVYRQIVYY